MDSSALYFSHVLRNFAAMKRLRVMFFLRRLLLLLSVVCLPRMADGQEAYFVDGFHGGVYGHYPLEWYTDFMVAQLEAHPEWRINLELEPETWDSVAVHTPEAYACFAQVVGSERVEVVNPTYAQPYLYNISGESIIRQFLYGMESLRRHFPGLDFLTYSSEEPCFTSALPQILSQLGFRYVVLKNPDTCWGGYVAEGGGEFVVWEGPDGTLIPCVPRYDCERLEDGSSWQTAAWKNSRSYLDACRRAGILHPVGMCLQDAGWQGGPWLGSSDGPRASRYVRWRDYFGMHLAEGEWPRRRFGQDDFRVALMWGSSVLQHLAQQVRRMENRVVQTEKLGAIVGTENGVAVPCSHLDQAWHSLMLSQHHDSWIVPYNNLRGQRTWADMIMGEWSDTFRVALDRYEAAMWSSLRPVEEQAAETFVRVFNTTAQPRAEAVYAPIPTAMSGRRLSLRDADGNDVELWQDDGHIGFVAHVPAFGYATYRLTTLATPLDTETRSVSADETPVLENDMLRIEIDLKRGGTLSHLTLKTSDGREMVDTTSDYAFGELRGYFGNLGRFCSSTENEARLIRCRKTPLEQSLTLECEIAGVPFTEEISLRKGSPLIDIDLSIRWPRGTRIGEPYEGNWTDRRRGFYDTRYMLSSLFPAAVSRPCLSKDAPFDVCESRQSSTFFNSWDSIRHNVLLHWADITSQDRKQGLSLFSDHTTSYSFADDYPLALTLQYAGPGLWGRNYPTEGTTSVHFSLYPHGGDWEQAGVTQLSETWQEPLVMRLSDHLPLRNHSLIQTDNPNLVLTSATIENGDFVFRLYNASRTHATAHLSFGMKASTLTEEDLLGNKLLKIRLKKKRQRTETDVELPPFGIRTYRLKP